MPGADQAGRTVGAGDQLTLVQRAAQVRALVVKNADLAPVPDHDQGQVTEPPRDRPALRQVADLAQVVPAERGQVGDRLGVAGARAHREGQVPAEEPARGGRGQPAQGKRPAAGGPAGHPGQQRPGEQDRGARPGRGVHQAYPLLLAVQLGPVHPARRRGRHRGGQAQRDQRAAGPGRAGNQIEHGRRGPEAERQAGQRGVRGLAERDPVQRVRACPWRQHPADHAFRHGRRPVQLPGVLQTLGGAHPPR